MTQVPTQFPSFGSASLTGGQRNRTTFRTHGYFSDEAYGARLSNSATAAELLADVIKEVGLAQADLSLLFPGPISPDEWHGLGFWFRTLEACQGAAMLANLGMGSTAVSALRTGLECLFYAAAIWRDPQLVDRVKNENCQQLRKMAKAVKAAYPSGGIDPEVLELLNAADVSAVGPGLKAYDAAIAADMARPYAALYRGFSTLGAHASDRSLLIYEPQMEQGRPTTILGKPDVKTCEHVLRGAKESIEVGRDRFREHFNWLDFS